MKYCSVCGSLTVRKIPEGDNRERDCCENCGTIHYTNPKIIVGTIPYKDSAVLLCKRGIEPRYGKWTLPGGFLENGETVIGPFVIIPSMSLVETLGYAGMDFCILDTEHGPLSIQTVNELVISAQGADIAPIVRIPNNEESLILRALDIGADGVQVPQINTILDAKRVVESAKYSPLGHRGVSIFTRAGNYYKDEATNHTNIQNEETMTVVHIEGKEGLDNLNEIIGHKAYMVKKQDQQNEINTDLFH